MKKGNKILSYILTLVLLAASLNIAPLTVNAEDSGGWQYRLIGGEAEITGYTGPGGNVVIPDTLGGYPVVSIGVGVFADGMPCFELQWNSVDGWGGDKQYGGNTSLHSITIPDSVTSIGQGAFQNCQNLRTVIIGKGVKNIGNYAFYGSPNVAPVFKSKTPPYVGEGAFYTRFGYHYSYYGFVEDREIFYRYDIQTSYGLTLTVPIGAKGAYSKMGGLQYPRWLVCETAGVPSPYGFYDIDDTERDRIHTLLVSRSIIERDIDDTNTPNEVLVKSGETPVPGATVTLTYSSAISGVTDSGGKVSFNDVNHTGAATLRVTKEGYHDYEETVSLPMRHTATVNLTEEVKPYLRVANYNGTSFLREVAYINRQATTNTGVAQFEFDCEIESGAKEYHLQYKSGEAEVKADGRFTLLKKQFVKDMPVFLTVVANNGKSHTERLNIQINDFTFPEGLTQKIGDEFSLRLPDDSPVFPGATLTIPKDNLVIPIIAEVTDTSVKLGFNVDPNGKNLRQLDEIIKSDFAEITKNAIMLLPIAGYAFFLVDVAGYAEVTYLGDNEFAVVSSNSYAQAIINAGAKAGLEVVEVQLEWLGSGNASGKIKSVNFGDYTVYFGKTDLDLDSEMTLKLGGGVPVVLDVGVYGKVDSKAKMQVFPEYEFKELTVRGEMGVYGQFIVFERRLPVLNQKNPLYLYPFENNFTSADMDINALLYDADNYSFTDASSYSAFDEQPSFAELSAFSNSPEILRSNAYTYIKPQIVTCGDTTLMAYIDKAAGRDQYNFPALVYRLYENGGWSAAQEVNAAEFADSEFSLYTDGAEIYIAYTEANRTLTASDDMESVLGTIDVHAAKFNKGTKEFDDLGRITNDSLFDRTPVMTNVNGNPAVLWLSNSANDLFGTTGTNSVMLSVNDGGTWQTTTLDTGLNAVTSLQAGILDGESTAAIILDGDNDLLTSHDRSLYTIGLNPIAAKLKAGDSGNIEKAVFSNDSLYVYRDLGLVKLGGSDETAINGELLNSDFDFITMPDGGTALVYKAQSENGVGLYASILDGDTLSEPVVLTETEKYIDGYALAVIDGELTAAFVETEPAFTDDDFTTYSDFKFTGVDITKTKLELGEMGLELSKTGVGNDFDIIFEAKNLGMADISGFKAEIVDEYGVDLSSADFDDILSAGSTSEFAITVSSFFRDGKSYILRLSANGSKTEKEIVFDINDCMIDAKSFVIGNENIISVSVVNMGLFPAKGTLYGYNGDAAGEVIFERETRLFEENDFVNYQIKASDLDCTKGYVSFVFIPDEGNENPLGNTAVVRLFDTPEWISLPDTLNVTVTGTDKTILFEDYPKEGGLALIVALYKGGRLTGTEIPDISSDGNITTTIDIDDADTIKLMLWNSLDAMMPLCKAKTIEWIDDAWESD